MNDTSPLPALALLANVGSAAFGCDCSGAGRWPAVAQAIAYVTVALAGTKR
jgi:hypothetical protein